MSNTKRRRVAVLLYPGWVFAAVAHALGVLSPADAAGCLRRQRFSYAAA